MKISSLLVAAALCPVSLCSSLGQEPPPAAAGYHLVFSDNFKPVDISPDRRGAHTWYEGVWFHPQRAPISHIKSTQEGLLLTWKAGQPQFDTSIESFSQFGLTDHSWRFGYFEVRMRWKPEVGSWPAIWLIPDVPGLQPEKGEFDLFEGQGAEPHTFFGTIHDWRQSPDNPADFTDVQNSNGRNAFQLPPETDFAKFHTYGMLWEPDRITWYFDDKPLHSEPAYPIFAAQNYGLILGIQAGANWQGANMKGVTARKLDMNVQWVHVWQH